MSETEAVYLGPWVAKIREMAAVVPSKYLDGGAEQAGVETDTLIGALPDSLVLLRGVGRQLVDEAGAHVDDHIKKYGKTHVHDSPDCQKFDVDREWLRRRYRNVDEMFWISVGHHFGIKDTSNLAVRKGNVLVQKKLSGGASPTEETVRIMMPTEFGEKFVGLMTRINPRN